MAQRRCGYCRLYGHMTSACKTKAGVVDIARRHVGRQRVELTQLLIANGFGIGALVNAYCYEVSDAIPSIVTQESLDNLIHSVSFLEFHNVKYTKRVSTRLHNYTGNGMAPETDEVYNYNRNSFHIKFMPMKAGVSDFYAYVHISSLMAGNNNNPLRHTNPMQHSWDHYAELLVPSNEGAADVAILNKKFRLHDRLGGEWVEPILP